MTYSRTEPAPPDTPPPREATAPALRVTGVSKAFSGVRVLDNVSFSLDAGQVLALIGENGAGKSTMVKILTGVYQADEGEIHVAGSRRHFDNAQDSWSSGIAAIHQETVMFDEMSIAENIFLGHPPMRRGAFGWAVDWPTLHRQTREILDRLDLSLSPETRVKDLGVAEKHMVEVARALSHDARVIIMDEPTAALSQQEIAELYRIVRQLRDAGKAIIFISHKFEEIFEIADRYVVLRDGRHVGEGRLADIDIGALVSLMVGRSLDQVFPKVDAEIGDVALEARGLCNDTEFSDIDFAVRHGEILGFYGLVGAGRSEVMKAIFGIGSLNRGEILLNGRPCRFRQPRDAIRAGVVYVPEDRQTAGAVLDLPISNNISLACLTEVLSGPWLSERKELALTRDLGRRLHVRAAHWQQKVAELSGGNQQKVVIAKWLATKPKVIILDEPTKGIDVAAKAAVHTFMGDLVRHGLAVILISSELPELLGMSDRVCVMREGRITARVNRSDATPEGVAAWATGAATSTPPAEAMP